MPLPFQPGDCVAAYFRDSGGDEQELSIPQQERFFLEWCKQNHLQSGEIFKDSAKPGSSVVGREDFLRMIRYFRSGEAKEKGLVIWKYSRFSRDVDDAAFYRADLRRLGYVIHSLNDNIPDGPEGRFFEAAIDWMNQRFLEDLSTDVKRGLRDLVQIYHCVPGTPPRGFKREPVQIGTRRDGSPHIGNKWIPDPELIPRVKQAFEMRAAGSSLYQIHKATHLYGSINSYRTFFTNPLYIGILEFGDLVIQDYCPPVISIEIWDAVQKRITAHAQARFKEQHPKRVNSVYLLSGLLYCAICGAPMNGNTVTRPNINGRDEAYRCSRSKRRADCTAGRISSRFLEDAVITSLKEEILLPDNLVAIHAVAASAQSEGEDQRKERLISNQAERKKLSAQIANITKAIADKGHSQALLESLTALESKRAELQAEHDQLQIPFEPVPALTEEQIKVLAENMVYQLTEHATHEERRQVLRTFIHKVIVERDGNTLRGMITYYYPPSGTAPPFDLAPAEVIMLPTHPLPVGAPRYRQTFTQPFIYEKSRSR